MSNSSLAALTAARAAFCIALTTPAWPEVIPALKPCMACRPMLIMPPILSPIAKAPLNWLVMVCAGVFMLTLIKPMPRPSAAIWPKGNSSAGVKIP